MEFPKWNEFTPENVEAKLATLLATSEKAISELEKSSPKGYGTSFGFSMTRPVSFGGHGAVYRTCWGS